jgi:hypothetical protein
MAADVSISTNPKPARDRVIAALLSSGASALPIRSLIALSLLLVATGSLAQHGEQEPPARTGKAGRREKEAR